MTITINDVLHLPELDFESTRSVGTPVEIGEVCPVRGNPRIVKSEGEEFILGVYRCAHSGKDYLVHTESLRPYGGYPKVTDLDNIHLYKTLEPFVEEQ